MPHDGSALRPPPPRHHLHRMEVLPAVTTSQLPAKASKDAKITRVTGKVRAAIEAMVWDCLPRDEAAAKAGISPHGLYKALRKPPVKAAYLAELEVLRTSERARDIHTLNEVRDQTSNQMARVQAVKTKWQIEDGEDAARGKQAVPGLQIVIVQSSAQRIPADGHTSQVIDMVEER